MQTKISLSNWSDQENEYYRQKKELLAKISSSDVASAPFLFTDRQLVTTILTRIKLFEKVLNVQGAIVECGVHKANSLLLYYHLSTILEPYNFNRKIIGFDTFGGFRSLSDKDDSRAKESDFSDVNLDTIKTAVKIHDMNRCVGHIEKIELVAGDACFTIPEFVKNNEHLIIAMLYLDFDIYKPTDVALKHLLPLVPKGGIVGFDEVNCKKWKGETIALKDNLKLNGIKLERFYFDPGVSYYYVA